MTTPGFRSTPLHGLRYPGRRHRTINDGERVLPEVLRLHWSGGPKNVDALVRFFAGRTKEASYNWAFGRDGDAAEMIPPTDAAWDAGDGACPSADQLLAQGFVPAREYPAEPARLINLRGVSAVFCNRGPLQAAGVTAVRRAGGKVVEAKHRNPVVKSTTYEAYPEAQLEAFDALLPAIVAACPTLKIVMAHEDVTNGYVEGRHEADGWKGGSKSDVGPAFPWHRFDWAAHGLTVVRFDYNKPRGWRVYPQAGGNWNGPGMLPRSVEGGP